jgi:DNA-binding transcriptional ArsR family regulator
MVTLSDTFAALGDATRLGIVQRLLEEGELPAGRLQERSALSAPAVSRHLKVLHQAGIVERRIDKQRRLYSVKPEAMQAIGMWSLSYRAFWEGSLDRLELALAADEVKQ